MIQDRKQAKDEAMRAAAAYIQAAPPQGPNNYSLQKKLRNTKDYLVGLAVGLLVAVAAVFFIKQFLPDSFYTHLTPLYNILLKAETAAPPAKSTPENVVPTPRQSAPTEAIADSQQTIRTVPAQEVVLLPQGMSASAPVAMENIPGSFPEASARPLVDADLTNKTGEQLLMMANEIFARHGYIFSSSKQARLFKTFPWYKELHENVDDKLSGIEKQNIALILAAIAAPLAGNQNTTAQTAAPLTPAPAISTAVREQPAESIPAPIAKPEPLPEKPATEQVAAMAKETPATVNPPAKTHVEPPTLLAIPVRPPAGLPGKYPETSLTILSPNDLAGRDVEELKLMRNEIFARHGYIFQSPQQQKYFSAQPWYRGERKDVTNMLTETEKGNIALIKKTEQR